MRRSPTTQRIAASDAPAFVVRSLVRAALPGDVSGGAFSAACAWAEKFGGRMIIEFAENGPRAPTRPRGFNANELVPPSGGEAPGAGDGDRRDA